MRVDIYDDNIGCVELIDFMGDDQRAVASARVSLARDTETLDRDMNERDLKLMRFLIREHHTSPFEHSTATMRIVCPLFCRAQIMRHRTFSFNEVSRRYTAEDLQFYIPSKLRKQAKKNLQCSTNEEIEDFGLYDLYGQNTNYCLANFNKLIEGGVSREQARMILPQSMYTTFWMTGNLLNWVKFLKLRLDEHTQHETRSVARGVYMCLANVFPLTMQEMLKSQKGTDL